MILRICKPKTQEDKKHVVLNYAQNSILLNSNQMFFVSKEGKLEFCENSSCRKGYEDHTLVMLQKYRKPYLQINYEKSQLSIRSLYFIEASTSDFYRIIEDTKEGKEEEVPISLGELKQQLCNPKNFDAFYIINQEAKLLTAMNLVDGVIKNHFDIQKAMKEKKEEKNHYDYIMIGSKEEQMEAKYFSINQNNHGLTLKTKEIPLSTLTIYDVVEQSAKSRIEEGPNSSFPSSREKVFMKQKI